MAVRINGKDYDFKRLEQELTAAGVALTNGLGFDGADVHRYDGQGRIAPFRAADLPLVQSVMTAHVPPPPPPNPSFGSDAATLNDSTIETAVASLRAYITETPPTNASRVATVKLLCRVCLALIKRAL